MKDIDTIFIGDSLTFGYGVSKKDSFVSLIINSTEKTILNKGVNGDTSTGILTRYYRDVISHKPRKVVILCGTNDLLMGRDISSIIENIELMIKDLVEINSEIIVCSPPIILKDLAERLFSPCSYYNQAEESLPLLNTSLINLEKKYPITVLDLYSLTKSNLNNEIFSDGVHLTPKGNLLIFNLLRDFI